MDQQQTASRETDSPVPESMPAMEPALSRALSYARSLLEASLDPWSPSAPTARSWTSTARPSWRRAALSPTLIGSDFGLLHRARQGLRAGYQQVFSQGQVTTIRWCCGMPPAA